MRQPGSGAARTEHASWTVDYLFDPKMGEAIAGIMSDLKNRVDGTIYVSGSVPWGERCSPMAWSMSCISSSTHPSPGAARLTASRLSAGTGSPGRTRLSAMNLAAMLPAAFAGRGPPGRRSRRPGCRTGGGHRQ